jgi:hypothetical protein
MRVAFLAALMLATLSPGSAGAITETECKASLDRMFAEAERNRIYTVNLIRENQKASETDAERKYWETEIDRAFDQEEIERNFASSIWNDCMQAAKS